ncbi:MAG: DUF305 domain-containing protein [Frankia sp.]
MIPLIATMTIAACGSSGSTTTTTSAATATATASTSMTAMADHDTADVTFAQDMIPHHQQAVTMAGYAATRASSAQVKALAAQIEKAQGPEITTMTGWLRTWGQTTASDPASMPGMDTGATPAMTMGVGGSSGASPAMMSDKDLMALQVLHGTEFDRMFLTMMISHHSGALTMAATELRDGRYSPAKQLAQSIVTSQTAQIATMKKLLAGG